MHLSLVFYAPNSVSSPARLNIARIGSSDFFVRSRTVVMHDYG